MTRQQSLEHTIKHFQDMDTEVLVDILQDYSCFVQNEPTAETVQAIQIILEYRRS